MLKKKPANLEIELRVLGCTLLTKGHANHIMKVTKRTDFYFGRSRAIYDLIAKARQKKLSIDMQTLVTLAPDDSPDLAVAIAEMGQYGYTDDKLNSDIRLLRDLNHQRQLDDVRGADYATISLLIDEIKKDSLVDDNSVLHPQEVKTGIINIYKEKPQAVHNTGFASLDPHYKISRGQFTVVTGIPGHGKSEFLDALLINLVRLHNWKFVYFSPENYPLYHHYKKLIEKFLRKELLNPHGWEIGQEDLEIASNFVSEHFRFINPGIEHRTIDYLLRQVPNDVDGYVIDPWNELEHHRPSGMSETEYISLALAEIRQFAQKKDIHIWIVAHPTKLKKDPKTHLYEVPTPYDISGSAHWRNKADNCITIYRDVNEPGHDTASVHVQKIRHKDNGKTTIEPVVLNYDWKTGCYHDPGNDDVEDEGQVFKDFKARYEPKAPEPAPEETTEEKADRIRDEINNQNSQEAKDLVTDITGDDNPVELPGEKAKKKTTKKTTKKK